MSSISEEAVKTTVVINKFMNGYMNGYIFDRDYVSNLNENEKEDPSFPLYVSVWKYGVTMGKVHRDNRNN